MRVPLGSVALYIDEDQRVVEASLEAEIVLGLAHPDVVGRPLSSCFPKAQQPCVDALLATSVPQTIGLLEATGSGRWLEVTIGPPVQGVRLVYGYDVSDRVAREAHLRAETLRDPLTGLANRTGLREYLTRRMATAEVFAVALIDLDEFKKINDSVGHMTGDELLQAAGKRLVSCVGTDDLVARLGGDEFAIALGGIATIEAALAQAESILERLRHPFKLTEHTVYTAASIGVTLALPEEVQDAASLLKRADLAMYQAKRTGRNRACMYQPDFSAPQDSPFLFEQALYGAVRNNDFELHYQPIFALSDGRVHAAEALIRWNHNGKLVPPGDFIPVAEKNGLVVPLGRWALTTVCEQIARWTKSGVALDYVSVNVSPLQLQEATFIDSVRDALTASGIAPSKLMLEITEGALMADPLRSAMVLAKVRDLGAGIAIDDFGTGYSSLAYLLQFPLTTLKLDRSFIADLVNSDRGQAVVRAVISLARELDLRVIAEGVETEEQRLLLENEQCELAQGWLVSKALPVPEFEAHPSVLALSSP